MKKRTSWKDHFYFTRSERYGSWVLALLLALSFLLPKSGWLNPAPEVSLEQLDEAVLAYRASGELRAEGQSPAAKNSSSLQGAGLQEDVQPEYRRAESSRLKKGFPFDPNTVAADELSELGFSSSLARTFLRYRNSGARFYKPADLLRVYGMSEAFFSELEPYIRINSVKGTQRRETQAQSQPRLPAEASAAPAFAEAKMGGKQSSHTVPVSIDINTADRQQWEALPGIGPYYAGKILRFRKALGGFCSLAQVGDTRALPDSVFQKIQPFLKLETPPRKLDLAAATAEELAAHPYISRRQAEVLVKYREWHGDFHKAEDLLKTGVFDAEAVERLKPYLAFQAL